MSNPEFQPNTFNIGFYSREIHQSSTIDGISVTCSHGTRMAGVMAAPRNGTGPIGVAYRSNLYSSWGQESVTSTNGVDQQQAIRDAVNAGAKVVVMAWATAYAQDAVGDEIDNDYYNPALDVVFVGAAGSSPAFWYKGFLLFPALKPEVLSATGVDYDNGPDNQSHYGAGLDLIAFQAIGTVGNGYALDEIANSSAATAFVGGVAAMVRGKYPWMTNAEVMFRMVSTSGSNCMLLQGHAGAVNAEAAVGGFCRLDIDGPWMLQWGDQDAECREVTYTVSHTGAVGPFSYTWNSGNSTSNTMTETLCRPPGRDYDSRQIVATVNDLGMPGVSRELYVNVTLINWSAYTCEERPDINECGGGGGE